MACPHLLSLLLAAVLALHMTSCDDSCRSVHDGSVNSNCAPPCETVEDCKEGEVCVEDWVEPEAKICAQPCTSSGEECGECICADGETGYCGGDPSYAVACRADGNGTFWAQAICNCQSHGDQDAFKTCMQNVDEMRASIPTQCTPLFDQQMFCFYRSLTTNEDGCDLPEGQCQAEADALASC